MSIKRFLIILMIFPLMMFGLCSIASCHAHHGSDAKKPTLNSPQLLNSERIAQRFGSYGLELLLQDESTNVRLANLYSGKNDQKVMRTLALTRFDQSMDEKLKNAHHAILTGGSIGATLKKYGFAINKKITHIGLTEDLPKKIRQMMRSDDTRFATLVYDLIAIKEDANLPYCTIIEIYSPEYLTLQELKTLHKGADSHKDELSAQIKKDLALMHVMVKAL